MGLTFRESQSLYHGLQEDVQEQNEKWANYQPCKNGIKGDVPEVGHTAPKIFFQHFDNVFFKQRQTPAIEQPTSSTVERRQKNK